MVVGVENQKNKLSVFGNNNACKLDDVYPTLADCVAKFNNTVIFSGEPFIPSPSVGAAINHYAKLDQADRVTLKVEISNLQEDQARQFRRLFAWMNVLGSYGSSRSFKVFYDGDGAARARISIDGEDVRPEKDDMEREDKTNFDQLSFGFD
jgi:hypothetical protein